MKDGSAGGYFSKINFGGSIRSPPASTKPPGSSNGGLTTILSNSSQTSFAAPSTASGSTPSIRAPGLYRKVSSSFLKQPKARIRTSSIGAHQIVEPAHKYDTLESITSQRQRPPIPTFQDPTPQEPRGSVSELSPTTTIDGPSGEPRKAVLEAEGASAAEMELWAQATYRPDPKMFLNATAGGEKQRSGSIAGLSMHNGSMPSAQAPANAPNSPSIEALTYSHIQEMASKRIATLDYLRKAYVSNITRLHRAPRTTLNATAKNSQTRRPRILVSNPPIQQIRPQQTPFLRTTTSRPACNFISSARRFTTYHTRPELWQCIRVPTVF